MHVVILAAGRGSRLGEITSDKPKLFLNLGSRSVYDRQLAIIEDFVDSVTVVLGHGFAGKTDSEINDVLQTERDVTVDCVLIEDWKSVENAKSLEVALEEVPRDDLLVLCGDVLFTQDVISKILGEFHQNTKQNYLGYVQGVQDDMTAVQYDEDGIIKQYGAIEGHQEVGVFVLNKRYWDDAQEVLAEEESSWFPIVFEELKTKGVSVPEDSRVEINTPEQLTEAKEWIGVGQ